MVQMRGPKLMPTRARVDQARMTAGGVNTLGSRVESGAYEIDEHAVAEAMLSRMLIPAQLFGPGRAASAEGDAGTGLDSPEPDDG